MAGRSVLLYGVRWGPYVPLGLLFIAEAVKDLVDVEVVFDPPTPERLARVDLLGVSSSSFGIERAVEAAATARRVGVPSCLGGVHGTFAPTEMLEAGFDHVVRGEGEDAFRALIGGDPSSCCRREPDGTTVLAGIHTATELRQGYDGRHLRSGFWGTGYTRAGVRHELGPLISSRGCPHRCTFCTVPAVHPGFGDQALSAVEAQLRAVVAAGYTGVRIYDSIFGFNRDHGWQVASLLARYGLVWIAETTVGAARHDDLLAHYARCGCIKLEFGLETVSPRLLRSYRKPFNLGLAEETIRRVQGHGIQVETYLLVGGEGETDADVDALCAWFGSVMPDNLSISLLAAYPGTELHRRAVTEGYGTILDTPVASMVFETASNGERYTWIAPTTTLETNVGRAERIYQAWQARGGRNPWVEDRKRLLVAGK